MPRSRKPPGGITATGIALIVMGVVGSALTVAAMVVVLVFWLPNIRMHSRTGSDVLAAEGPQNLLPAAPGPNDPIAQGREDTEKEKAASAKALPPEPLPPAPHALEFASPAPRDAAEPERRQAPVHAELDAEVVRKVKQATVRLRVTLPDGGVGQGSGFFALERGLILTNAHVVGMLLPGDAPPKKIEVIQNSGTKDEKKYSARLLGVDRRSDLAVLRVDSGNPPAPLEVKSARNLRETQRVWVVGFPLGDRLGKEITVSDSSVSSLRREDNGVLSRVQVNGGMHPGNSGGPVVDAYGDVVGMAVSGLRGTQINFAVPGDYVRLILDGRVSGLSIGQPVTLDGKIRAPVTLSTVDPLQRLLRPALEIWTGSPGPSSRPPCTSRPGPQAGDSPHERHALDYKDGIARGQILLPALPPGKTYWVQPAWVDPRGETRWASAQPFSIPVAVTERAAPLSVKHQVGSRPLVLNKWLTMKVSDPQRGESTIVFNSQTRFEERVQAIDEQDQASVQLQYLDYNEEARFDNQPFGHEAELQRVRQDIRALTAYLQFDRAGNPIPGQRVDPAGLPARSSDRLKSIHWDMVLSLEGMTIPLPNKSTAPGDTWQAERTLPIGVHGPWPQTGVLDVAYSYLGSRPGPGGDEGVVSLTGKLRGGDRQSRSLKGRAEGSAVVDLGSGQVKQVDALFTFDLEMRGANGVAGRSNGTMNLRLRRGPSEPKPAH